MNTIKQGDMPTREMNWEAKESTRSAAVVEDPAEMATQAMEPEMVAYLKERQSEMAALGASKPGEMPKREMNQESPERKSAVKEIGKQGGMPTRGMN
jgi:hypothetical protein